jgi:hypothetical protein
MPVCVVGYLQGALCALVPRLGSLAPAFRYPARKHTKGSQASGALLFCPMRDARLKFLMPLFYRGSPLHLRVHLSKHGYLGVLAFVPRCKSSLVVRQYRICRSTDAATGQASQLLLLDCTMHAQ